MGQLATVPALLEVLEPRRLLSGQTIIVNTTYDGPSVGQPANTKSLREAITEANADSVADTILFDNSLTGQTINLTQGELLITTPITITGLGASNLTINGGSNGFRVFHIDDSTAAVQDVVITGLKITGGNVVDEDGGALSNNENLTLTDVIVSDSNVTNGYQYGQANGGGIYNSGTLSLSDSTISGNTNTSGNAFGGGIYNSGTFISIRNKITGNSSIQKSLGYGAGIYNAGTFTSTNDTISENFVDTDPTALASGSDIAKGGAIYNSGTFTITNGVLKENSITATVSAEGGAIYISAPGTLRSFNSSIFLNTCTSFTGEAIGGGIQAKGRLWSTNDTIAYNIVIAATVAATTGPAGIVVDPFTTATLINDTITENGTGTAGFESDGSNVSIINSIILGSNPWNGGVSGVDTDKNILEGFLFNILHGQNPGTTSFSPLLENNGGPTSTIALVNGSPAIGTGIDLATVTASGDAGTTLTLDSSTFIPVGVSLIIGTEIVHVTAVDENTHTLTVLRAQDGTTQSNLDGKGVRLAFDARGRIRLENDMGAYATSSSPHFSIPDLNQVYSDTPVAPTTTLTGLSGIPAATLETVGTTLTYYSGSTATGTPLSSPPSHAGTYTVVASFAGSQYYSAGSEALTFVISAATPVLSVIHSGGTYTGSPRPATASVAGIEGTPASTLESVGLTITYYSGSTFSGTPLSGAPTNAGTYTAVASFPGSPDYVAGEAFVTFTITRATPTVEVINNGGLFSGAPYPAVATVTGINTSADSTLEGVGVTITYYSGTTATGTPLSGPPTAIGTYTAVASFAGSDNHLAAEDTVTFAITRRTKKQTIRIDHVKYTIDSPIMTGLELLQFAGKSPPENYSLTRINRKGEIQTIGLNQVIDFTRHGPWWFFTRLLT